MRFPAAALLLTALAAAQEPDPVPSAASSGLTLPPGATATIFATTEGHQVVCPSSLCVDEQGRVFVTETHRLRAGVEDNRDHRYWLLDDLSSTSVSGRERLHAKWNDKVPISSLSEKSERVRILTDTDGDGVADGSGIFAEEFKDPLDGTASGIFALDGTVYFACIPHIWTLRDTTGDGAANQRTPLLSGFGNRVSLSGHDLNGFALGPDGRLYGTIGDRAMHVQSQEGHYVTLIDQGAVFRFEPDGSQLELIHWGLRNPKEVAFDQWGNAVTVDNNSDQGDKARLVYVMEGGDSGWRTGHQTLHTFHQDIGLELRPINQWMEEHQWEPANEHQPAFLLPPVANIATGPSGLTYHPGTGLAGDCRDSFLVCDYTGGAAGSGVRAFGITPDGAGMQIVNPRKWFWGAAVTDIEFGYDGKVYITDFIGGWKSHDQGRIHALSSDNPDDAATEVAKLVRAGFGSLEAETLYDLLGHADQRVRLRAQLALAKRHQAFILFTKASKQTENQLQRLHGVWGLWSMARKEHSRDATAGLLALLGDPDAEVRAQAARALGEAPLDDAGPLGIALRDSSRRVQAFAALSLGRLRAADRFNDLVAMLGENGDQDIFLRHAGVVGLIGCGTPARIAALRESPVASIRLAAVVALRRLRDPSIVQFLFDEEDRIADEVIRAVHDTPIEAARPAVAALLDNYASGQDERPLTRILVRRLLNCAFRVGGEENASRLLRSAGNAALDPSERIEALRLLSLWSDPPVVDQCLGRYMPIENRDHTGIKTALEKELPALLESKGPTLAAAIDLVRQYGVAVASLDDASLLPLARDRALDAPTRLSAIDLLASRKAAPMTELLGNLVDDPDASVATKADRLLIERQPDQAITILQRALASDSPRRKQSAWKFIKDLPGPEAAAIIAEGLGLLTPGAELPPYALEILEAAEGSSDPAVQEALMAWQSSLPTDDPLAGWRIALRGGNPAKGEAIFRSHPAAQCLRCHSDSLEHASGGDAGPNLGGIGFRRTSEEILQSILDPSATIVPGFGTVTLRFANGGVLSGILQEESESHLKLLVGTELWLIDRSDIVDRTDTVSAMPLMRDLLTKAEVRDLLAWLTSLDQEEIGEVPPLEAKPFDPFTIAPPEPVAGPDSPPSTEPLALDPAVMKLGKGGYALCMGCHGPTGKGLPGTGPPLAGSEWVMGPPENLIRIQLRGLTGPITVHGQQYNFPVPMAAQSFQSDEQIAAVLTYVRNSFGNSASPVTPAMVQALRSEVGMPMLTADDLIPPAEPDTPEQDQPAPSSPPQGLPDPQSKWPWWGTVLFILALALAALSFLNRQKPRPPGKAQNTKRNSSSRSPRKKEQPKKEQPEEAPPKDVPPKDVLPVEPQTTNEPAAKRSTKKTAKKATKRAGKKAAKRATKKSAKKAAKRTAKKAAKKSSKRPPKPPEESTPDSE